MGSHEEVQGGYAEVTGTLTVYITDNSDSLATRLMESVHLNIQDGAKVKLYMDAVSDGDATDPQPDDTTSTLIAGSVQFTDFSTGKSRRPDPSGTVVLDVRHHPLDLINLREAGTSPITWPRLRTGLFYWVSSMRDAMSCNLSVRGGAYPLHI